MYSSSRFYVYLLRTGGAIAIVNKTVTDKVTLITRDAAQQLARAFFPVYKCRLRKNRETGSSNRRRSVKKRIKTPLLIAQILKKMMWFLLLLVKALIKKKRLKSLYEAQ